MSYCNSCGANIPDGSQNCPYCGSNVSSNRNQRFCNKCGNIINNGSSFCSVCGNKVDNQASNVNIDDGSKLLGILSIIAAFFFPIIGLILGAIGMNAAKNPSDKSLCRIGFILSLIFIILIILFFVLIIISVYGSSGYYASWKTSIFF